MKFPWRSHNHNVSAISAKEAAAAVLLIALVGVTAIAPGTNSTYRSNSSVSAVSAAATGPTCAGIYDTDKSTAVFQYALSEGSGAVTAPDVSGYGANGTYQGSMTTTTTTPLPCSTAPGGAYALDGSSSYLSTPTLLNNPTTYTQEIWFKTSVAGGRLMGFSSSQTGSSVSYDRQLYINTSGQIVYGIWNGTFQTVTTPSPVTDNRWHHVAATLSPTTGMVLYLDGQTVASNPAYTQPQNYSGYWRIGYDNLATWANTGTNYYFTGSLRYAAAYTTALTPQQIANHYTSGH